MALRYLKLSWLNCEAGRRTSQTPANVIVVWHGLSDEQILYLAASREYCTTTSQLIARFCRDKVTFNRYENCSIEYGNVW
jgi:hypothetical protein